MIRHATLEDGVAIAAIYNHYIANTVVTFEEEPVDAAEMAGRVGDTRKCGLPWLVAVEADRVVGYGYLTKWKSRCSYRYSVESSIYFAPDATGRGLGSEIYRHLIDAARALGLHAIIGGVSLPNPASTALHEKIGFKQVAHFRETGFKLNQWIDVGYWELLL
ncbi:MAG: Phosphinothricin N-acetyltransferase [Verrucomicrobiota bacterium]|jgi:phosphinothricin acetyltransferase